jgi:hypothetical protein
MWGVLPWLKVRVVFDGPNCEKHTEGRETVRFATLPNAKIGAVRHNTIAPSSTNRCNLVHVTPCVLVVNIKFLFPRNSGLKDEAGSTCPQWSRRRITRGAKEQKDISCPRRTTREIAVVTMFYNGHVHLLVERSISRISVFPLSTVLFFVFVLIETRGGKRRHPLLKRCSPVLFGFSWPRSRSW